MWQVTDAWQRIETWLRAHAPASYASLPLLEEAPADPLGVLLGRTRAAILDLHHAIAETGWLNRLNRLPQDGGARTARTQPAAGVGSCSSTRRK
ncbi:MULTISPECIES: hypothetical protein [unclassified Streptomyces]|uniref:Uncharacterized protein n=1 Tax=Streptomyces sp. NBC_00060 TaxID=2975636 RepID=A0AAU2GTA8_9ACTN